MPETDFRVEYDPATGQITVANIKSRMSLDEAEALAAELVNATANRTAQVANPLVALDLP